MPSAFRSVDDFLAAQSPETQATTNALRQMVMDAEPSLLETIKWNSPNFSHSGEDRLTVNVGRDSAVRLVLHLGTKVAEHKGAPPSFTGDPQSVLVWHSDVRATLAVASVADIDDRRAVLTDVVRAWLAQG